MDVPLNFVRVAQLLADGTRVRILSLLMDGRAHTATELSIEGDVMPATASFHLGKLVDEGVLAVAKQGRHRYFRIGSPEIASLIEGVMGVAAHVNLAQDRKATADRELRAGRSCYDHLAGEFAVAFFDSLLGAGMISQRKESVTVTTDGVQFFGRIGIDCDMVSRQRRLYCGACMDWTERRYHLSGAIGAAVFIRLRDLELITVDPGSRRVGISNAGKEFLTTLAL